MKSHFNILQYQFPINFPYQEGHILTAHEANVFNHYRADLIRRIARRWVVEAVNQSPNELLSVDELAPLAARIAALDSGHEYTTREEPPPSPLEYQLNAVALQIARSMGISSPTEIENIKRRGDVQRRAREILLAGHLSFEDLSS